MKISNKLSSHQRFISFFKSLILLFFISLLSACFMSAQVDTILVGAGWNMIGSLYAGVPLNILSSEPSDIIVSAFFNYNPGGGYEAKDTLKKGVGYWVKVSEAGIIIFGKPTMGIPCPGTPTVDYGGKIYNTVLIGTQCWLKENLDIGTRINGTSTQSNNGTIEKYCYNDATPNCTAYGGLYQLNEAMQYTSTPGGRGICPPGWHIPTGAEFSTLNNTVGGDGNALKDIGQGTGSGVGTNTSDFSGLLAGYRYLDGTFLDMGFDACFWTSDVAPKLWYLYYDNNSFLSSTAWSQPYGLSIRCIKD